MLEVEKREYPFYEIDRQTRGAILKGYIRLAVYLASDRRDEDNDHLCVYLKKTYRGVCDMSSIKEGNLVMLDDGPARVISVSTAGVEQILHLEIVEIIDTGAVIF